MRLDEKQNLFAVELSDEDIEIVSGGENCTYGSQTYSPGSVRTTTLAKQMERGNKINLNF